jgi:hypothetical protein
MLQPLLLHRHSSLLQDISHQHQQVQQQLLFPLLPTAGECYRNISTIRCSSEVNNISFVVDNTGGASNVTIALGTGGSLSDAATIAASAVAFGRLVVAAGATGMAQVHFDVYWR